MDLGTFHTEISGKIRRGTSMDANIVGYVRRAAYALEQNYGFQYMRHAATVTIDPDVETTPQYIDLSSINLKLIRAFRWEPADGGDYIYLTKVDFEDFEKAETGTPRHYWLEGTSRIVLGSVPDTVLFGKLYLIRYSDWPTQDSDTHWLLDHAERALIQQSMIEFGIDVRDMPLVAAYRELLKDSMVLQVGTEVESEWSDSDLTMGAVG